LTHNGDTSAGDVTLSFPSGDSGTVTVDATDSGTDIVVELSFDSGTSPTMSPQDTETVSAVVRTGDRANPASADESGGAVTIQAN
jgi:hypothetical protein